VRISRISVDYAKWGSVRIARSYESDAVAKGKELSLAGVLLCEVESG
jgi:hypothetical protein